MNYSFKQPVFKNDTVIKDSNFSQLFANTAICEGVTGLKFIDCNLQNCLIPEDAKTENCSLTTKDYCSHLHPKYDLPVEAANCRHATEEILEDGVLVGYIREDL